jgi:FKBP-type peptidyl-prolyl cis-trans isomerase
MEDYALKNSIASRAGWLAFLVAASISHADGALPATAATVQTAPAASPGVAAPAAAMPDLTREEATRLIGVNFGQQLLRLGITDPAALESLSRGMKEGLGGTKATADEQQRLAHYFYASTKAAVSSNLSNAHAFLLRNAGQKDVHTTSSGLQYIILAAGDSAAASPTLGDQVMVRYRGTLLDGTEFDSSDTRGAPKTFLVSGVIKGWQEALVMMKPGAKWRLFIPPELAYGSKARRNIPGGSLLIFDVELTASTATPAS